jgi:hypothetical protein
MRALFVVSILIFTVTACYSQESAKPDPAEMRTHAYNVLRETPHRITLIVEMRDTAESEWQLYSSQAKEVVGRDRWHLVQHTGLKRELIGIGDRTYQKMPGGTWQLLPPKNSYTGATVRQLGKQVNEPTIDQKKDGGTVVETSGRSKMQILRTGEVVDMEGKNREWFDDTGRLTRTESEHFNYERKKLQRMTEIYEYDPTIKIEAPIENK